MTHTLLVNGLGLVIGLAFGIAAQRSGFCLASALRSWWRDGETLLAQMQAVRDMKAGKR